MVSARELTSSTQPLAVWHRKPAGLGNLLRGKLGEVRRDCSRIEGRIPVIWERRSVRTSSLPQCIPMAGVSNAFAKPNLAAIDNGQPRYLHERLNGYVTQRRGYLPPIPGRIAPRGARLPRRGCTNLLPCVQSMLCAHRVAAASITADVAQCRQLNPTFAAADSIEAP